MHVTYSFPPRLKVTVKRGTYPCNLFCDIICCEMSWIATLRVLPPKSQTVLNNFGYCRCEKLLLQTPTSIFRRSANRTIEVVHGRSRISVKIKCRSTFTRDLPYIASTLFTRVTIIRQWKSTIRLKCFKKKSPFPSFSRSDSDHNQ